MDLRKRDCKGAIKIGVIDTPEGHSHSTKVIKIIKEFVPNAEIVLVGPNIHGVKKLIEEKPAIVNMSMKTSGAPWLEDELAKYSFLVTSAGNNGIKGESFAAMDDRWCAVGAVGSDMMPKDYSSYGYGKVKTVAIPHFGFGTSYASPVITGLLAQWYVWHEEQTGYYPNVYDTNRFVKENSHDIWEEGKDLRTGWGLLRLPKQFQVDVLAVIPGNQIALRTSYTEGEEKKEKFIDLLVRPEIKNDRLLVPFRGIGEGMNLDIRWNPEKGEAYVIK